MEKIKTNGYETILNAGEAERKDSQSRTKDIQQELLKSQSSCSSTVDDVFSLKENSGRRNPRPLREVFS
jgi:hypothetical protein